jgi:hypothetical protein
VLAEERERRRKVDGRALAIVVVVWFYVPLGVGLAVGLSQHSLGWGLAAFGLVLAALAVVEIMAVMLGGLGLLVAVFRHRHRGRRPSWPWFVSWFA